MKSVETPKKIDNFFEIAPWALDSTISRMYARLKKSEIFNLIHSNAHGSVHPHCAPPTTGRNRHTQCTLITIRCRSASRHKLLCPYILEASTIIAYHRPRVDIGTHSAPLPRPVASVLHLTISRAPTVNSTQNPKKQIRYMNLKYPGWDAITSQIGAIWKSVRTFPFWLISTDRAPARMHGLWRDTMKDYTLILLWSA